MCHASALSPQPVKHTAASASGSSSAKPAASPIEMPLRDASHGRHGLADNSPSDQNPCSVDSASEPAPPTSAASHNPAAIARAAAPNTFALEEHAVEMVTPMPRSP